MTAMQTGALNRISWMTTVWSYPSKRAGCLPKARETPWCIHVRLSGFQKGVSWTSGVPDLFIIQARIRMKNSHNADYATQHYSSCTVFFSSIFLFSYLFIHLHCHVFIQLVLAQGLYFRLFSPLTIDFLQNFIPSHHFCTISPSSSIPFSHTHTHPPLLLLL